MKKGFTLIELMVVILIVAILAAVAIPILRRIDSAKWAEGKAIMGTIATACRAFGAEYGEGVAKPTIIGTASNTCLGFIASDLTGTYFNSGDFAIATWNNPVGGPLTYSITATPTGTNPPSNPSTMTLTMATTGKTTIQ